MTALLDRPTAPTATPADRGRLGRLVRGPADAPVWARPALLALLALTGGLYAWGLAASGNANSFYAAAVQAGSQSWKAWLFGALDSGSSITVDKPPAALWVMGLSARVFGFNSWSLLLPQAVEGVVAVGLLYGCLRRSMSGTAGHAAGLVAAGLLALTPAAVLMFRFDNPDALLVTLLVLAAYAVVRAVEAGRTRWLVIAGTALGFAFLAKMLQAFLVLPGLGLAYLVAAPVSWRKRCWQLAVGVGALVVSAGWFVLTVALWPASSRPYIGGSGDNSVLGLAFGYNGLSRLSGGAGGPGGPGGSGSTGSSFGGATGVARLFSNEFGNEVSWLLPAALVALGAGLWLTRRAPLADRVRAGLLLWGGWLAVTALVFAYMKGTVHPYYTVALAPAIAALVALGAVLAWTRRDGWAGRVSFAAVVAAGGAWSIVLLGRVPSWHPELRVLVGTATALAVAGALLPPVLLGRWTVGAAVAGVLSATVGLGAFGLATAASAHTGSIPTVGPAVATASGAGPSGLGGPGGAGGPGGPGGSGAPRFAGAPGSIANAGVAGSQAAPGTPPFGAGTGLGGGRDAGSTSTALTAALKASTQTWAAATTTDQAAASLELASGKAVIAIGGWSGSDDSPTLAQFERYVAAGRVHYFVAGGGMNGGTSGGGSASAITRWVAAHYAATTLGGTTVYDLTGATTG